MKEFIFTFNYTGYISTGVEKIDEKNIILNGLNIYTQDLKYPKLLNAIKEEFQQDIEVIGIKYLQIQHSNVYSHSPTDHLLISFKFRRETNTEEMFNELQDKMETTLTTMKDLNKIYYFTTNFFVDYQISSFLEEYLSKELIKEDLKVSPSYKILNTGFYTTITSFVHKNYSEIINTAIKGYLDDKFVNLLGTRALNVYEKKLHHLTEGNFKKLDDYISLELLPFLSRQISDYNISIIYLLHDFKDLLFEMQNSFEKYEYSVLIDLEKYFYEIRNILDSKFRLFPNIEYGDLFFTETSTMAIQESPLYNNKLLKLYEVNHQNFQLYRNNLKTELSRIMDNIRLLKSQKKDKIKIYTKTELKDILENIKDENEFQNLITKILQDLGYTDIKINCGRRGHLEYGKDIVFSHRNMFKHQEWDAIVVKKGKIDQVEGRKDRRYIKDIISKGSEAFLIPYEDEKGRKFQITRVFIATNDKITDPAKISIRTQIEGRVFFIEKDTLLDLC